MLTTIECVACSTVLDKENNIYWIVCKDCYVDPETNKCSECDKKLEGICYRYICGSCVDLIVDKGETK